MVIVMFVMKVRGVHEWKIRPWDLFIKKASSEALVHASLRLKS
jgi:hypothetical protein